MALISRCIHYACVNRIATWMCCVYTYTSNWCIMNNTLYKDHAHACMFNAANCKENA